MSLTSLKRPAVFMAGLLCFALAAGLTLDRLYPLPLAGRPVSTVVLDRSGIPLRAFADSRGIWRFSARPDEVSPLYLEALLGYEDRWFYYHPGVNPLALGRAVAQNLIRGRIVSGGSTITMQVARILDTSYDGGTGSHRKYGRKFCQMLRAVQLEFHLSKDDILRLYLTHAPFGANIEGVRAAAWTWLGKDAAELTHAEAALLAVLPQAPSRLRPDRHPERAARARAKVLRRLAGFKIWPEDVVRAAGNEPVIAYRFPNPMAAPLASRRLRFQNSGKPLVRSTLDGEFQLHTAELLRDYSASLPPGQSGAVLVVNHRTMAISAYAGSADFGNRRRLGHVDMIRAFRSPGSTLKPFIYGLAMDEGIIHSHSLLLDVPRFAESYDPGNFTGGFAGPVTAARALQDSLNLPAVQVLEKYGPVRFHDRLKNAGARFRFKGKPNLSMALGGMGTSLESLVTLYSALARQGLASAPRLKETDSLDERYLMSPGAAWITRKLLSRPLPGREGIARLSGDFPVAWKTGTSYGFRDAWAVGIKGDFIVGVWIGRPDGTPSPGQYGAVTAVPLMARVMENLPLSHPPQMPANVTRERICWPSGLAESRVQNKAAGACARRHAAWILDHRIPPTMAGTDAGLSAPLVRTFWVDREGRRATPACGGVKKQSVALWPLKAEAYIPSRWRRAALFPEDSPQCPGMTPPAAPDIRIVSVSEGSLLRRQPGSPGKHTSPGVSGPAVPLIALGGQGRLYWFLNRRPLNAGDSRAAASFPMPEPGGYQLSVVDETGNSDQVSFRVISPAPGSP
ncbi:MAG TPA: penicillin-binding protein 1C [Desulfobacteraceae bacterium]|nr:penicillin-binding protein 1C [Desulfobacteraceae bacterium]